MITKSDISICIKVLGVWVDGGELPDYRSTELENLLNEVYNRIYEEIIDSYNDEVPIADYKEAY